MIFKKETKEKKQSRILRIAGVENNYVDGGAGKIVKTEYTKRDRKSLRIMQLFEMNEEGDAQLLIEALRDRYVFDHNAGEWYYWNDHYWREDEKKEISRRISEVVEIYNNEIATEKTILFEATKNSDERQIKKSENLVKELEKRIYDLRSYKRQQHIVKMISYGKDSLCVTGREWDQDPWLLGCKNGTIDLKKGEFRPGQESDYIRSISPVEWKDFDAPRPLWEKFMVDIMCENQNDKEGLEIIEFLQMLFGYSITGLSTEHIYPICYGADGRNGKSTLFEILKEVLGILAYKAPSKFLMQNNNASQSGHDTDQTEMRGKRIVWCSESNERDKIDAAKIKELTGGDTITARAAYARKSITFQATHTMFIHTNYKPQIPPSDTALWSRLALINFKFRFVVNPKPDTNEKKIDPFLKEKLCEKELPGILAWLVEGCIKWQKSGKKLIIPTSIKNSTEIYRKNEDIVGHFLKACCIEGFTEEFRDNPGKLFSTYREWCFEDGHHSLSRNRFYQDLDLKFGERRKIRGNWYYFGIVVNDFWKETL